jgi:hypothetical protein
VSQIELNEVLIHNSLVHVQDCPTNREEQLFPSFDYLHHQQALHRRHTSGLQDAANASVALMESYLGLPPHPHQSNDRVSA